MLVLNSTEISIISPEISNFCFNKKYMYRLHFNDYLLILLTLIESLKTVLINVVEILMMSTKLVTLGLLRVKVFQIKVYYVIIFVHDITNKILLKLYCRLGYVTKDILLVKHFLVIMAFKICLFIIQL